MPVLSATVQNINPQYNPPNPFPPPKVLQQVQVTYNGTAPGPVNGVMTLYAERVGTNPPETVTLAQEDLNPRTESSSVSFQNVSLAALRDGEYRFYAVVTQSNGDTVTSNYTSAYPVDGEAVLPPPPPPPDPDPDPDPSICFLAGTRIRTPRGDVAIEALRIGDLVTTLDGAPEPIRFIGRQSYATRFADPMTTWPVLFQAGALGEGVPAAELMVSPAHAMHLDGVLVAALALVNGTTIRQVEPRGDAFTYFNLEFDRHALVLAEGAAAESFADNVSRTRFHNHAEFAALYPEGREVGEMELPRAASARQVPAAIRRRIAERAEAIAPAQDRSVA